MLEDMKKRLKHFLTADNWKSTTSVVTSLSFVIWMTSQV